MRRNEVDILVPDEHQIVKSLLNLVFGTQLILMLIVCSKCCKTGCVMEVSALEFLKGTIES